MTPLLGCNFLKRKAGMSKLGLLAFWPMSAASGDEADAYGAFTMTASGTPGAATGLIYPTARTFDGGASKQFFTTDVVAAVQNLGVGADFTAIAWFNISAWPTSSPLDYHTLMATGFGTAYGGWKISINQAHGIFSRLYNAATYSEIHYDTPVPSLNTWHMVTLQYDLTNGLQRMRMDAYDEETIGSTGCMQTSKGVALGRKTTTHDDEYFEGLIGPAMVWTRLLTALELAWLYNDGAGRTLATM
jgi:hypothetical protein